MTSLEIKHKQMLFQLHYILVRPKSGDDVIKIGEELVGLLFDETTDGFWVWDIKNDIEYYSPKFIESLGYTKDEFPYIPQSWMDAIFPEDHLKAIDAYKEHLADPKCPYYLQVRYRHKQGHIVKLICAGTIVNRGSTTPIMLGTHEIISTHLK